MGKYKKEILIKNLIIFLVTSYLEIYYLFIYYIMKILLAITTFNEIKITDECLEKITNQQNVYPHFLRDDYSNRDNIKFLSKKYNIPMIGKVRHTGLTHSWNLAYKYFIENDYDFLFISNNDVLIPEQTLDLLSSSLLNSDCYICSTLFNG